jgi:site-specific DNA-adenine methylase
LHSIKPINSSPSRFIKHQASSSAANPNASSTSIEMSSATDFILDLYKDYRIEVIKAKRAINSKADKRGDVDEVLVMNFEQQ